MTLALLVLGALIIIGFVKYQSQKNKEVEETNSQGSVEDQEPYQTTQEEDNSYYEETFRTALVEEDLVEETVLDPKPPAKKATAPKKTSAKKTSEKKPAGKKTSAKKSTSKKSSK